MRKNFTPRGAVLESIKIHGHKRALCLAADIARPTLDGILERGNNPTKDIMEIETGLKFEKATGIPWRFFCPATYKSIIDAESTKFLKDKIEQ